MPHSTKETINYQKNLFDSIEEFKKKIEEIKKNKKSFIQNESRKRLRINIFQNRKSY